MTGENRIVFDLETQNSFDDVGGKGNMRLLKVSVLGAYDYETRQFRCYEESELPEFEARLCDKPQVIGFNIRQFDLPVLAPYLSFDPSTLSLLDLMEEVTRGVGHRVSLNSLAAATLGQKKVSHGLEAIRFWREGRLEELKAYCLDDVRLTRDLYEYGRQRGELLVETNFGMDTVALPVRWDGAAETVSAILAQAFADRRTVEIEYAPAGAPTGQRRRVNIYGLTGQYLEGFCHLRQDVRSFRVDRVRAATLTDERYAIPSRGRLAV